MPCFIFFWPVMASYFFLDITAARSLTIKSDINVTILVDINVTTIAYRNVTIKLIEA